MAASASAAGEDEGEYRGNMSISWEAMSALGAIAPQHDSKISLGKRARVPLRGA
jgi:hypothetical protein